LTAGFAADTVREMNEPTDLKRDRDELAAYNPGYCRKEKLIRMYAGCSSEPFRIRDGVVEIEIRLSDRALDSEIKRENVIRELVANWRGVVPGARRLKAHIYRTGRAEPGFNIPASSLYDEDGKPSREAVKSLAEQLRSLAKAERVDIKLEERIY
jgi:hypothetical protein